MKKKYYCKYCKKEISRYSGKYGRSGCKICSAIHANRTKQQYFCLICNKEISWRRNKCYSCAHKGKKLSEETKKKIKLSLKGRKRPDISKLMIAKGNKRPHCLNCDKELYNYNAKHCWDCYILLGLNKGINASNYINGASKRKYAFGFTHKLKLKIRERDNYTCQNCDMIEEEHLSVYGRALEVHHINYNKEDHQEENLITLCQQCNIRANYNRKYWTEFFSNKLLKIRR